MILLCMSAFSIYATSSLRSLRRTANNTQLHHVFIAVMGMTGAGKSSFIKTLTGSDVFVGHGLASCEYPACLMEGKIMSC